MGWWFEMETGTAWLQRRDGRRAARGAEPWDPKSYTRLGLTYVAECPGGLMTTAGSRWGDPKKGKLVAGRNKDLQIPDAGYTAMGSGEKATGNGGCGLDKGWLSGGGGQRILSRRRKPCPGVALTHRSGDTPGIHTTVGK